MIFYLIVFIVITLIYLFVSIKKNNFLNVVFFSYWSYGVLMLFMYTVRLGILRQYVHIEKGDIYTLLYFLLFFIFAAQIELCAAPLKLPVFKKETGPKIWIYLCLIIVGLFWIKNKQLLNLAITNPRMFYANSRVGGGLVYYVILPVSIFLYFVMLARINFSTDKKASVKAIIYTAVIGGYLYLFGQKALILKIVFIFLTTYYYKNIGITRTKKLNKKIIQYIVASSIIILFVMTSYFAQQMSTGGKILNKIVNYSDYLLNFNDLVDNLKIKFYGSIFLEDEFFSFIPRAIWPQKPTLFGSLQLGLYVPRLVEWTKALTGAPSFGPLGQVYSDFGILGIPFKLLLDLLFVYIAKTCEYRLYNNGYNFYNHWLLLTFCNLDIFKITLTSLHLYQIAIIVVVYISSMITIKSPGRCYERYIN